MEGEDQQVKSRVVKVDSVEAWELFLTQANNQGCPVLVHFTASWCMPSVAMNPFFEELALSHQDILFLLVDVDELKEVASKMEVKAMPTFLLLRGGVQVDKLVGANPDEITKRIDGFLESIRLHKTGAQQELGENLGLQQTRNKIEQNWKVYPALTLSLQYTSPDTLILFLVYCKPSF